MDGAVLVHHEDVFVFQCGACRKSGRNFYRHTIHPNSVVEQPRMNFAGHLETTRFNEYPCYMLVSIRASPYSTSGSARHLKPDRDPREYRQYPPGLRTDVQNQD